jgi:hypothetical protein
MGLVRAFEEGQGMSINGEGVSIDVTVKKIIRGRERGAILTIRGFKTSEVTLDSLTPEIDLFENIKIYLPKRRGYGNQIHIGYEAPQTYIFDRIE